MFFYRYKPRSTHLHKFEAEMHKRYLSKRCKLVRCITPTLHVFKFFDRNDRDWIYCAINPIIAKTFKPKRTLKANPAIYGFCSLTKIPRWVAHEVSMLYVNPDARGKGISSFIYDTVLKDKIILVSGELQNIRARAIWIKLVKNESYTVWAQDLMDLSRKDIVYIENDELSCSLKLYNDLKMKRRKKKEDIRLIAVIK